MIIVVYVVCAFIVLMGLVGIVSPAMLETYILLLTTPAGVYVAAGFRLVFGTVLYLCAPHSKAPRTVRVLGIITIIVGLMLPFLGVEFMRGIMDWWLGHGQELLRVWGVVAIAIAAGFAYMVTPKKHPGK
jgi:hypothetical protein